MGYEMSGYAALTRPTLLSMPAHVSLSLSSVGGVVIEVCLQRCPRGANMLCPINRWFSSDAYIYKDPLLFFLFFYFSFLVDLADKKITVTLAALYFLHEKQSHFQPTGRSLPVNA